MQAEHGQFDHVEYGNSCPPLDAAHPTLRSLLNLLPLLIALSAIVFSLCGCARLQLPAIDPNGSSIFLPLPNTTQLTLPRLHERDGQPGILPTPAFTAPAMPPPCVDGSCGPNCKCQLLKKHKLIGKVKSHFASPGKAGEIQLTPMRVVAPVGGEVVLLAGICGPDGYLVKRQPLEWMLSPDSVGTFIEVGDDSAGHLVSKLTLHKTPKVEKLDVDFAKGRTSSQETLITRGSPTCEDDIQLREGQTWLSISSPSEGISRVTVLAPESDIWDRRRQTATIYWVDAQWEFPKPQIARAGQSLQFLTRVTKAENLVPAEDWIVQYTIVDPSIANFAPATGSNQATVRVNRDSQAIVQVVAAVDAQGQPARGTTPILIDVIRPAQPSDNLPELKLGSGQTFATFSSPGLNLQTFGPELGSVGEQLTYVASLGNPGDVPAENTQLVVTLPAGTRLISAVPEPNSSTNTGLIWDQGVLDAHRQLDVSIVLEAQSTGTFDVNFQAAGAGNLTAASAVRTEIIQPSVELKFEPSEGAAQAEIGQRLAYAIDVTNTSRQTLTDLRIVIESDPGLPEEEQGVNRVEQRLSFIQPGQTYPLGVAFVVRQEGQLAATVRVYAGEKLLAERSTSVRGLPPRPKQADIGLNIEFPATLRVNQSYDATITLRNPGEVKLTGLDVTLSWDAALRPTFVDNNNARRFRLGADGRSAVWSAPDLLPRPSSDSGDPLNSLLLTFECISPIAQGTLTAEVAAAEGVQARDAHNYQAASSPSAPPVMPPVSPPGTPPGTPPVTPPGVFPPSGSTPPARSGNWEIVLADFGDPTTVGEEIRYTVTVRNNQNQDDRDVRIQLMLPQGVNFTSVSSLDGTSLRYEFGPQNTVLFEPIKAVRKAETLTFIFGLKPQVPDVMRIRARVYSAGQPDPQVTEETTTVNPRN